MRGWFRCGVAMAGVYNIPLAMQIRYSDRQFFAFEYWKEMIGDSKKEKDKLRDISPYYHVDRLRAPVFIYHGIKASMNITSALSRRLIARYIPTA